MTRKRVPLLEIKMDIGTIIYENWMEEAHHNYDRKKIRDLTREEYTGAFIRWRYFYYKESQKEEEDLYLDERRA